MAVEGLANRCLSGPVNGIGVFRGFRDYFAVGFSLARKRDRFEWLSAHRVVLAHSLTHFQHLLDGLAVGSVVDQLVETLAFRLDVLHAQLTNIIDLGFGEVLGEMGHLP